MKNGSPSADDPLDRPLEPIAPIPGVDVDVKGEANARIIGARIPRPHRPNSGWEQSRIVREGSFSLNDPIDDVASDAWFRISSTILAGGVVAAIFYPVAIVRGGDWIMITWGLLAMSALLSPLVFHVDGYDHQDVSRQRAAHGLGMAPITVVLSWWGPMMTAPVFAGAFPVAFVMSITQFILAQKRHVRSTTRHRLMKATVAAWGVAGLAAIAKLVVMSHIGAVDGMPAIVPVGIALLCTAQAIRTAQAPEPVPTTSPSPPSGG